MYTFIIDTGTATLPKNNYYKLALNNFLLVLTYWYDTVIDDLKSEAVIIAVVISNKFIDNIGNDNGVDDRKERISLSYCLSSLSLFGFYYTIMKHFFFKKNCTNYKRRWKMKVKLNNA